MSVIGHGVEIVTSGTRPASPFDGMQIYETDTNKVLVYNGSSWVEISDLDNTGGLSDNAPLGIVARYTTTSTFSTTSTTPVDVTGATVTWTAASNKIYLVSYTTYLQKNSGNSYASVTITDTSNNVISGRDYSYPSGTSYLSGDVWVTETGLSGSVTRKIRTASANGTLLAHFASANYPTQLIVIDLGV